MKKYSNKEISDFCEELAMFIDGGVPTEEAISRMAEDGENRIAKIVLNNYSFSLSGAIKDSKAFPNYMEDMIDVGESTGRLGDILLNLSEYYEKQDANESRISGLLIYPSVLMFVLSIILLFIAIKLFPIFGKVYESLGGVISGNNQWIITFATVVSWVLFATCLIVAILSVVFYSKWKKGSSEKDVLSILSKNAYIEKIVYEMDLAKFTSAVNNYYIAGIDLESAISHGEKLVNNNKLKKKISNCLLNCQSGEDIAHAFRNENIYGTVNNRTLFSSISSGKLNQGLEKMTNHEWELVDQKLRDVTDSVEPLISLGLSVVIGILLISIMTPLIEIMTAIS